MSTLSMLMLSGPIWAPQKKKLYPNTPYRSGCEQVVGSFRLSFRLPWARFRFSFRFPKPHGPNNVIVAEKSVHPSCLVPFFPSEIQPTTYQSSFKVIIMFSSIVSLFRHSFSNPPIFQKKRSSLGDDPWPPTPCFHPLLQYSLIQEPRR